jgi:hypothetical protein
LNSTACIVADAAADIRGVSLQIQKPCFNAHNPAKTKINTSIGTAYNNARADQHCGKPVNLGLTRDARHASLAHPGRVRQHLRL